jgi:uncharacterized protein YbaP (TraB family)
MKRVVVMVTVAAILGAACKREAESTAPAGPSTGHPAASAVGPSNGATASLAHPLLWSADKAGHTTYFLGTIHMGIDAEARMPELVWSKLHDAPVFAMEADLDGANVASLIKPTGRSLHAELGEAYWRKLEDAIGSGPASGVDPLPAMVPVTVLSMRGLPVTEPMDKALARRVTREHKPIVFLEPAASQLALLGKWMDVKALKMMLDELPKAEQLTRAMLAAYIEGDEQRMLAISDAERAEALRHGYSAAEYDEEINDLLYARNAAWLAAIEQLHDRGGGFVAVGAMHLLGPRSVLDLLARKGYRVTRIAP